MKKIATLAALAFILIGCKNKVEKPMEASSEEIIMGGAEQPTTDQNWIVLFDGTSFDGWHRYNDGEVPAEWKIEDGAMVLYPPKTRKEGEGFNLVSDKEFTDFELSLDWKISEAGNSGVFWGVKEIPALPEAYQTGPEIQVLDNEKHPDAKAGTTHQAGSLYDMVPPSKDVTKPVGEWNSMILTINHKTNKGSVVLNGQEIVKFPVNNPEWGAMVAKSKFADWKDFAKYTTGKIGLQDHGNMVSFRDIKIKEL